MAKKPSTAANLVLLLLILVPVAGLGGLGWWGYKKFLASKPATEAVAESAKPEPAPVTPEPAPVTPEPAPVTPEPAPVTPEPVPVTPEPVPVTPEPAPVTPEPAPVTPEPAPVTPEPAPVTPMPEPVTPAPEPAPVTPAPEPTPVTPESAPEGTPAARAFTVFPIDSVEGKALLEDAERRIQEAPKEIYSEQKKLLVRRGLRSAKNLARVTTVYFGTGQTSLNVTAQKALDGGMNGDEVKNILKDPKAVVFVLGFSDPSGAAQVNQNLAKGRADAVKKFLGDGKLVRGEIHSIAIGSTEVISGANKEKNRAAEVWIVMQ